MAGLGAFHGLNPAMGWLFAVALGLNRNDRRIVWLALLPIAVGHALSVAAVAVALVVLGVMVEGRGVTAAAGLILIAWALYHWRYGSRHRVRVGLQTGLAGLGVWSFLMATGHGAGLMLWPVLMPLCFPAGVAAGTVYEWLGLEMLRRAWINLDLIWSLALAAAGAGLLIA